MCHLAMCHLARASLVRLLLVLALAVGSLTALETMDPQPAWAWPPRVNGRLVCADRNWYGRCVALQARDIRTANWKKNTTGMVYYKIVRGSAANPIWQTGWPFQSYGKTRQGAVIGCLPGVYRLYVRAFSSKPYSAKNPKYSTGWRHVSTLSIG